MKRTSYLLIITLLCSMFSCKKKANENENTYTCTTCKTTPDALLANDASSKGIYKGVIIGSSGTIKFDIANNGSTITAVLVIDGTTVNLTSNVTWVAGQAYTAPFTGTLNGTQASITFSVGATGQNATITSSTIPGHQNAVFTLVKETSSSLIECFEGKYSTSKPESGTFNLILSRSLKRFEGISRKNGSSENNEIEGTINGSNGLVEKEDGTVMATLSGDLLKGSFKDSSGNTVTVEGKRTF